MTEMNDGKESLTVRISEAAREDYCAIVKLWKASVEATHHFLGREDFLALEKEMQDRFLPAVEEIWLCFAGDELGGFCGNNGGNIEMLFVHPLFMSRGIGSRLIDHVQKRYGELALDVNEQNTLALEFYKRRGFRVAGRSEFDSQGRSYPIVHMQKID